MGYPALNAERARQRATDEGVPIAKSARRPSVIGDADVTRSHSNTSPASTSDGKNTAKGYGVTLSQSVFRGFRTINSIREAEANVYAGRADLLTIEQNTLLSAVTAYMNVVRDLSIVRLRQNNVRVLAQQERATNDRFRVGEVTKTDQAQARARRSRAVSDLNLARSNLKTSQAEFERIIGHRPRNVRQPPLPRSSLPRGSNSALEIAAKTNPVLQAAMFRRVAAYRIIKRIKGELLPTVDFTASYDRDYDPSRTISDTENAAFAGRLTIPFYQSGDVAARVRQAKQSFDQSERLVDDARVRVRADVISAWGVLQAERAQLLSDREQVRANRTALNGVKEEEKVGQRTVLDVLDAEQELLDAQVDLVSTKRDLVVAAYSVLQTVGRLTAEHLGLRVTLYDPEEHYRRVKGKWFGLGKHRALDDADPLGHAKGHSTRHSYK
ncbi:MAG: TolC family outer membrane protein [Methyloligellaceae bacterium]